MSDSSVLREAVATLCGDLSPASAAAVCARLCQYADHLRRWAPKVNLVSLADLPVLGAKHLAPSLSLRPVLRTVRNQHVVDVGSGAGLPGLPLAIAMPRSNFTLVESRRRRATFLRFVARDLELENVTVANQRVEAWQPIRPVDLFVSRAVAGADTIGPLLRDKLSPHGFVLTTLAPRSAHGRGEPAGATHWFPARWRLWRPGA